MGQPSLSVMGRRTRSGALTDQALDTVQVVLVCVVFDIDVVVGLDVDPEALAGPESAGESQSGFGSNPPPAADDLPDAGLTQGGGLRQAVLADPQRLEELGAQDLSRRDRVVCLGHRIASLLVVVDDLDVCRPARGPGEADAELVVDSDRVLTGSASGQLLQAVARRNAQIAQRAGRVEEPKLLLRGPLNVGAQPGDMLAAPDLLCVRIGEGLDGHSQTLSHLDSIA